MARAMQYSRLSQSLPEFVSPPDERYNCAHCKLTLRPPVSQLGCGHLLCGMCEDELASQGNHAACPGGDDECLESQKSLIHPDRATDRELLRMKVHCPNKDRGCATQSMWEELFMHKEMCSFNEVKCPNNGCGKLCFSLSLKKHLEDDCKYALILCATCDKYIHKSHFDNGHAEQCALQPRRCCFQQYGCTFVGLPGTYQAHLRDSQTKHANMQIEFVSHFCDKIDGLKIELNNSQATIDSLKQEVESLKANSQRNDVHLFVEDIRDRVGDNLLALKVNVNTGLAETVGAINEKVNRLERSVQVYETRLRQAEDCAKN